MTRVALLWHMHQPFYQDLTTGEHVLPWVRLHALKDYWGMVALLREFPRVRLTFNLVPSLLTQLEAFARDEARDPHLAIGLEPPERLSTDERAFCVEHFFHAHRPRMIDPYPRYRELLALRGGGDVGRRFRAAAFSNEDLRDLQVWHKLVWIDPWYHEHDARVRALVSKGRGFTETDKQTLRAVELELLRQTTPEYRDAARRGQVELSTSPFYHPILPLLCDTDVYLRAHPHARMPSERFRHPEDAAEQLARAVALHERLFGARPAGLWPSEGSVSDATVALAAEAGFTWLATDEDILARSLDTSFTRNADGHMEQPERLYLPYVVGSGGQTVACGFRDHALSDRIGFSYASWSADGAADDFVHRLVQAGRRYAASTGGGDATIFVILDGENAWEHYDGQGRPFLRALYGRLQDHAELQTVTMTEACAGATVPLRSIFPGSWINSDFYIWIGHADDQRAWGQLAAARRTFDAAARTAAPAAAARAREELLIAEGSDWFWWYGDDHSSDHDLEFDELFRSHVRNVYKALDAPVPEDLFVTNITTRPPAVRIEPPTGFIRPVIDGQVTSYFEWIGAGGADAHAPGGTMHQTAGDGTIVSAVEFGFDLEALYVRLDGREPLRRVLASGLEVRFNFLAPTGMQAIVRLEAGELAVSCRERRADTAAAAWLARSADGIRAAADVIVETAIPFRLLGAAAGARVAFVVQVTNGGAEVEHHPRHGPIELAVPDVRFPARNWTA